MCLKWFISFIKSVVTDCIFDYRASVSRFNIFAFKASDEVYVLKNLRAVDSEICEPYLDERNLELRI